jgi:flagellar basal body-associated protein FliL
MSAGFIIIIIIIIIIILAVSQSNISIGFCASPEQEEKAAQLHCAFKRGNDVMHEQDSQQLGT